MRWSGPLSPPRMVFTEKWDAAGVASVGSKLVPAGAKQQHRVAHHGAAFGQRRREHRAVGDHGPQRRRGHLHPRWAEAVQPIRADGQRAWAVTPLGATVERPAQGEPAPPSSLATRPRCAGPEWSETADRQAGRQAHIRLHADNIPNGIVVGATPSHWERFSNGSHLD